ncbi:MAG: hypothetical protein IJB05_03940 [Bacteroidales bacterium]|nr:hypothetical protein [Bacteroidales bacterium]
MNVAITYHEAQELISRQFNLKLGLSMADGRTMSVEYNPGLLLPTVRVDIHIEAIQGNTLILTYKCIPAVALLVQGAVKLLGDKVPAEIMKIDTSTRSIQMFLDGVEQLKEAFKYVKLQDVYLETDKIYVDLLLK